MMQETYKMIYPIASLFMTYIIYRGFSLFYTKQIKRKGWAILGYGLYFVVTTYIHLEVKIPIVMLTANVLLLFLLTFLYGESIKKGIVCTMMMYFFFMCIEMVVIVMLSSISFDLYIPYDFQSTYAGAIICILAYAFVVGISKVRETQSELPLPVAYWGGLLMIPLATMGLLFGVFSNDKIGVWDVLFSTVSAFGIQLITFYLYDRIHDLAKSQIKQKLLEEQHRYYDYQLRMMARTVADTRKLKHDLKNQLTPIYALAKEGCQSEVVTHIEQIIAGSCSSKTYSKSGNTSIDSILNFKLGQAAQDGIAIKTEVVCPATIAVDPLDMGTILGNLLDNAMEAVDKVAIDGWITVDLNYRKGCLLIDVQNAFDGEVKKSGHQLVTRKRNKLEHGIGINSVQDTLKKYDGELIIGYAENTFKAKAILYVSC